jgi:hypothetical protein
VQLSLLGAVVRSGFVNPVLVAGAKAKNVTSNLPLLSVLAFRFLFVSDTKSVNISWV